MIRYYVINKESNKVVFFDCSLRKCEKFLDEQENKDNFVIGHKWHSF